MENKKSKIDAVKLDEATQFISKKLNIPAEKTNSPQFFAGDKNLSYVFGINCIETSHDNNQRKELASILNTIYDIQFDSKWPDYLGAQALNEWILNNFVPSQRHTQRSLQEYLHLDPKTFFSLAMMMRDLLFECSKVAGKKISDLMDEDLVDLTIYKKFITTDYYKIIYLDKFYNDVNPSSLGSIKSIYKSIASAKRTSFDHLLVNKCVQVLRRKGNKELSILTNLIIPIRQFFTWLISNLLEFRENTINDLPVWKIKREHVEDYKAYLLRLAKSGEKTESGAKNYFRGVKRFFNLATQINHLVVNVTKNIRNIQADDYHYREIPSLEQIKKFFEVVKTFSPEPHKEVLAFRLMLQLGLRSSEVGHLKWEFLNLGTKNLSVKGKNGSYDIFPLPSDLHKSFYKLGIQSSGLVFGNNPKAFSTNLYHHFKIYAMVAEWNEIRGPHIFRHTFISKLAKHKKVTPQILKKFARHKSLLSTSKYIHFNEQQLREEVNKISYGDDKNAN